MVAAQIVTVADAKSFLNITQSTFDAELSDFIDSASQMIVNRIGPVAGSPTYDEWYDGGNSRIFLRHGPVQSITSVTESYGTTAVYTLQAQTLDGGTPMDSFGYTVDLSSGMLVRRVNGVAVPFARGTQNVHVKYVAGYATVPADIELATKLLLSHMWETQRGGSVRPGSRQDQMAPGSLDAFPPRVEEILADYYTPGIA